MHRLVSPQYSTKNAGKEINMYFLHKVLKTLSCLIFKRSW